MPVYLITTVFEVLGLCPFLRTGATLPIFFMDGTASPLPWSEKFFFGLAFRF